jgi:hypothetical protein
MTLRKMLSGPIAQTRVTSIQGSLYTLPEDPTLAFRTWQHTRYKASSHPGMMTVVQEQ